MPLLLRQESPKTDWTNWHQTVSGTVEKIVTLSYDANAGATAESHAAATTALQSELAAAIANKQTIRALGGRWSFSPIAFTPDILLDTEWLNMQFYLSPGHLDPSYSGSADFLCFAQCGVFVKQLNALLANRGQSLKATGASNGQTIAGAIATGTHGAAIDVGAIHDAVVGFHTITGANDHVFVQRASRPVVNDRFVSWLGARSVRDDAIFEALRVSLGSMGLVLGVLIETEPLFYLQRFRTRMPVDAGLWHAIETLDFSGLPTPGARAPGERPWHFEVLFNPYDAGFAYVTQMYKSAAPPAGAPPIPPPGQSGPGTDAPAVLGYLTDRFPALTKEVVNMLLPQLYGTFAGECGTIGQVFTDTTTRGSVASTAMGIPLGSVQPIVKQAIQVAQGQSLPGFVGLRFVKSSTATLAFTRHTDHTCVVEMDSVQSQAAANAQTAVWNAVGQLCPSATFHWGKQFPASASVVQRIYGGALADWVRARKALIPDSQARRSLSNKLLTDLGLAG